MKKLKKGFTLVELIVVLMLMGLITTALAMIIRPAQTFYTNVNNKTGEEDACITLTDYLNGKLRYATGVTIYCNDGTTPNYNNYGEYKHFIKLSNEVRTESVTGDKRPRGYAKVGLTANFSNATSAVSESLLDTYDVQFSIAGVVTTTGSESITIQMDCHPLVQNSTKTGFEVDTDNLYTYSETFQLVNLQNVTGKVSGGVKADTYDESTDTTIWIFYQEPSEAADLTNTTTASTGTDASSVASTTSTVTPSGGVSVTPSGGSDSSSSSSSTTDSGSSSEGTSSTTDSSSTPSVQYGKLYIHFLDSDINTVDTQYTYVSGDAVLTGTDFQPVTNGRAEITNIAKDQTVSFVNATDSAKIVCYKDGNAIKTALYEASSIGTSDKTIWVYNGEVYDTRPITGIVDTGTTGNTDNTDTSTSTGTEETPPTDDSTLDVDIPSVEDGKVKFVINMDDPNTIPFIKVELYNSYGSVVETYRFTNTDGQTIGTLDCDFSNYDKIVIWCKSQNGDWGANSQVTGAFTGEMWSNPCFIIEKSNLGNGGFVMQLHNNDLQMLAYSS